MPENAEINRDYRRAQVSVPLNITNKFREAFESYDPVNGGRWIEQLAPGDIVALDGNAAAASYLEISKDPLSAGVTTLTSAPVFGMPIEAAFGLHMSQRTLGQEFAIEMVSDEPPLTAPTDLAIASISQAASVLTATTATAHGLRPGMRIGIRDCVDSRMNYPALVVASTPTATQFTATAGPGGTIPSVTAGPFTSGFVFFRSALGFAPNGTSMIFENATATNASFYVRSESGDVLPSGTILGNHSVTILSTASVQAINAAGAYAFQPTNEFRLTQFVDGVQWSDVAIDSLAATNNRYKRTQVVPDISHNYRVRIRATNNPSLTRPVAKIVSATKTGTTTATVVTDVPHGLTLTDQINLFGARDQSNFSNVSTATAIASIVDAVTFTVVWGGAVTATTYGGCVVRVNGSQNMQGLFGGGNVQSVARAADGVVSIATNTTIASLLIGDYLNIHGCRDAVSGADLGFDGAYRVRNISAATAELEPIGGTATAPVVTTTNCGGILIRRTCLRVSFVRVLDFERQRVEMLPRPSGDESSSASVRVQGTVPVSGTVTATVSATTVSGNTAQDATSPNPIAIGGRAANANQAAMSATGDLVHTMHTMIGAVVQKPYAIPEAAWNANLALTTTTAQALAAAAGAGIKRHITALQAINTGAAAVDLILLDGATERWRMTLPVNVPLSVAFPTELLTTANAALNANLSASGTVRICAQGYTAP